MECMCSLWTQPAHRVEVLCTGIILHSDTAKQRLAVGRFTTPILGTQMLPKILYIYYHYLSETATELFITYCFPMALGTAIKIEIKAVSEL